METKEIYIPFSWTDPEKQSGMLTILKYLKHVAEDDNDYFEIGPPSAKLLWETLGVLIEGYRG